MNMQLSTWQEVEKYLQTSTGIIIPIGSTEQHGPNGLIGTDALCAEIVARGVAEKTGAMVAPVVSVGMAQHHLGFPGSITLKPSTLIAVICDMVNSLARHGFDRFYFLNGHGGNIATVTAAFSELYASSSLGVASPDRPSLRLRLRNWYVGERMKQTSRTLFGDQEGSHATPSEVSLTYFAYPDAVKSVPMTPAVAPHGEIRDAASYRTSFPDGRIGSNPALASVEAGEKVYMAAVEDTVLDYRAFVASS